MSAEQVMPGYKRTQVGVIPQDWEVTHLGAHGQTYGGLTGKTKKDFGEGNAYYVTFMDVMSNVVIDRERFDRVQVAQSESQNRVQRWDLLFNGSSETPEEVAFCSLVPEDVSDLYLNSFCFGYRLHPNNSVDPLFLAYLFRSQRGRELVKALAQGSTRYNISKGALLSAPLAIPPIAEQRAIATALSDVDDLLAKLDQLIAKKRDLKQATMQQLLTGQTRLPGFSGDWETKRLGDVGFANWGNVEITKDYYCESGFTAYSASGADGLVSWYEHEGEGIVLSAIGAQCGKSWLATGRWTPIKNTIWIKGLPDKLNSLFLYWISQSPDFWPTRGQAQPFIALGDVRNVLMSCPSLSEQIAITTILSEMDAELSVLETRRNKTRALKQGMMQELLTGRIRLVSDEDGETK